MDPLAPWDYQLPPGHIATHPSPRRDGSRLLVLPRDGSPPGHRRFAVLPDLLRAGDLVVANDTRVMAARLAARRSTGGAVELLLLEPGPGPVPALARPLRRLKAGEILELEGGGRARLVDREGELVRVELDRDPVEVMAEQGAMPLPPYLGRPAEEADAARYQTVYSGPLGAAAAPTAGLHFTEQILDELGERGIRFAKVTLHVGIATFRPLRAVEVDLGRLHEEWFLVPDQTARELAAARERGGRVVAVGTTTARALEAATPHGSHLPRPGSGTTDLFIRPPYRFRALDALLTNFHLPRSSLLMMVAALVGRERLLSAYQEAIREGYRFYSYGDAMLIV